LDGLQEYNKPINTNNKFTTWGSMESKSECLKDDQKSIDKLSWETPKLIKLDVEETEAKSKMYFNEFNVSYGAIS